MDANRSHQELDAALRQAFDFTADDLEINKRGQLSQHQQLGLPETMRHAPLLNPRRYRIGTGGALLLPLLAVIVAAVFKGDEFKLLFSNPLGLIMVVLVVLFFLYEIFFEGGVEERNSRKLIQQLRESPGRAQVESTKGKARKIIVDGGRIRAQILSVNNKGFKILGRPKFDAF